LVGCVTGVGTYNNAAYSNWKKSDNFLAFCVFKKKPQLCHYYFTEILDGGHTVAEHTISS